MRHGVSTPQRGGAGPYALLVLLLAGTLLGVANPSADEHQEALRAAISERHPFASKVGLDRLAAHLPRYDSVVVGSYTTWQGQIASVGVLGYTWVNVDVLGRPGGGAQTVSRRQ